MFSARSHKILGLPAGRPTRNVSLAKDFPMFGICCINLLCQNGKAGGTEKTPQGLLTAPRGASIEPRTEAGARSVRPLSFIVERYDGSPL